MDLSTTNGLQLTHSLAHHTSDPTGTGQNAGNTILEHRCTCEEFLNNRTVRPSKRVKCHFFFKR